MITNTQKLFINFCTFNNFEIQKMEMEKESKLQILRQGTQVQTPQDLGYDRRLFFIGVAMSCLGETVLVGYLLFSHTNISIIGFGTSLALLVVGNMMMLKEKKLSSLFTGFFKTTG